MRPALLAVIALLLLAASAAPAHLSDHDRRTIADLAQRYLQHRADKVTNVQQTAGFGIPTTGALTAQLRTDEIKLEARRQRISALPFGGYSHAETSTDLKRVHLTEDGSVVAHVRELTALYFEESATIDNTSFSMTHVLIFARTATGTGWALATATFPPGSKCGIPPETQFCGHMSDR
ncbi:hypothetical protein LFM09_39300 [Lentzea alba]|uniref:hypothetical protein n=1 Tax=Lentzea alba TaxID=2714351 RepID=UPI0039BFFF80